MQIANESYVIDLIIKHKSQYVKLDIYDLSIASIEILEYIDNKKYVDSYITCIRARDIAINKKDNKMFESINYAIFCMNKQFIEILAKNLNRKDTECDIEYAKKTVMYRVFELQMRLYEKNAKFCESWV
jgi:hypothetical protein